MTQKALVHEEFIANIDRYLNGELDIVETATFHQHSRDCQECTKQFSRVSLDRFEDGVCTLDAPECKPCLNEETLRRWAFCELPDDLMDIASSHIDNCGDCATRAYKYIVEFTNTAEGSP